MSAPTFFTELKRRNVIRMAGLYFVGAWLLTQIAGTVLPMFGAPDWLPRSIVVLLAIGFLPTLAFSWIYEITPEGIKRESAVERHESITPQTGRRIDRAIMVILALVFIVYAIDRFVLLPKREAAHDAALRTELAAGGAKAEASSADAKAAQAVAPADAVPEIEKDPSIAVLPLVNMSSDKEQEYFSDGISEELLNLLAKVPKLRVIARTSSFSFKGTNTPIPAIAQALHVASVLEGSVRKSGDKVRITAQLIRASDGSHLWSETYDRTLDDIFKVQDEIAAAVVEQLKIKLLGAAPTAKPVDPKAYPLILQGQMLTDQQSKASRQQAESLFKQAIAAAPNEARAWAGLARVYFNQSIYGERPAAEGMRLCREAANKALEIDPHNVIAIGSLARIAGDFEFDLPAAARYDQRALEAEPGNLFAINSAGALLLNSGRVDEAVRLYQYRLAQDPANPTAYYNLGLAMYSARRWDDAIDAFRGALRLSPDYAGARSALCTAMLLGKRTPADALKECEAEPDEASRMTGVALALHALGRTQEAAAAKQALIDRYGSELPQYVATVCAYRGETDVAFEWLDKATAAHDPSVSGALTEALFDSLHRDARWVPFLHKIGVAPEQVAKIDLTVTLPQ